MNYEEIKTKLLEIQEIMSEIPQDCKGDSEKARCNRKEYMIVKSMVKDISEYIAVKSIIRDLSKYS